MPSYTGCAQHAASGVLNWHFTDRYYHTNLDTIDKMSAAEMQHVAIAVATTALFLASADSGDVEPLRRLISAARDARMATEQTNSATPEILEAWRKWYAEALASVDRLRD